MLYFENNKSESKKHVASVVPGKLKYIPGNQTCLVIVTLFMPLLSREMKFVYPAAYRVCFFVII